VQIERGITRYDIMPIPPIEAHTARFEAGVVSIGVEYRLLDDAIAAAHQAGADATIHHSGGPLQIELVEDRGVSLHVFGRIGDEEREFLRFDCFDEDPHYHYVSVERKTNEMVHLDRAAMGDPLEWTLDCIRTRLPQMLDRAGAGEVASRVDPGLVERILPRVAEAAYRARFEGHDVDSIHSGALTGNPP